MVKKREDEPNRWNVLYLPAPVDARRVLEGAGRGLSIIACYPKSAGGMGRRKVSKKVLEKEKVSER